MNFLNLKTLVLSVAVIMFTAQSAVYAGYYNYAKVKDVRIQYYPNKPNGVVQINFLLKDNTTIRIAERDMGTKLADAILSIALTAAATDKLVHFESSAVSGSYDILTGLNLMAF